MGSGQNEVVRDSADFASMPFGIVLVDFSVLFAGNSLVRSIAIRLIFRQAAHANEDRLLLRFDFERLVCGFYDFAHFAKLDS